MGLIEYIREKKIDKMIHEYNKDFFKALNDNKNILLEAFVKYYGEEYRKVITTRMNNTYFYTFLSNTTIKYMKLLIDQNAISNTNIAKDIKEILNYYGKKHITAKFYYSGIDVQGKSLKEYTTEFFSNNNDVLGGYISGLTNHNTQSCIVYISICQYFHDETSIIHEINHTIRESILANYIDNNGEEYKITKGGIQIKYGEYQNDVEIEEILNHRATLEIRDIFHKLGGCISTNPVHNISPYEELFPLIEKFYQKYKTLLKKVAITDNMNALFSKIDKEKYEKYKKIICEQFPIVHSNNKLSSDVIDYTNNLVNQMDKNNNEKENIHEFIEELKMSGKTIKFLNSDKEITNNEYRTRHR